MFHIVNFTNDLFHVKGCGQRLESEKKTALCFDIPNDLFIVALNWHACLTGCRQTKEKKELFLSHLAVAFLRSSDSVFFQIGQLLEGRDSLQKAKFTWNLAVSDLRGILLVSIKVGVFGFGWVGKSWVALGCVCSLGQCINEKCWLPLSWCSCFVYTYYSRNEPSTLNQRIMLLQKVDYFHMYSFMTSQQLFLVCIYSVLFTLPEI